MPFFSAAEMADVRTEQSAALDQNCIVRTLGAGTVDAEGAALPGTAADVTLPCRKASLSANERAIADRLGKEVDAVFIFAWGTVLPDTAQIVHSSGTFELTGQNLDVSYQSAVRAVAKQLA